MKHSVWGVLIAASVLGLSVLGGCGKAVSAPSVGGETHWLQHCGGAEGDSGFDCGPGLSCVCGVCTSACTDDASCSGAGDGAVCAERAATAYADGCEGTAPQRMCVAGSDVVLLTAVSPPLTSTEPEPVDGYCGDGLFSTEIGCISCSQVRRVLQARAPEIDAKYNTCKSDDDCVLSIQSNNCDATCGVAVNRASLAAWSSEMGEFSNAYCRAPARWPEYCGVHSPNCTEEVPQCDPFSGRCYAAAEANPCSGRPLDQCENDTCTVATGRLYNEANDCFSPRVEPLRCVRRSFECPNEPTPFVDAEGNCYFLGDECVADTFRQAPYDRDCRFALDKTCAD